MHPHLINWFREVSLNPDRATVESRWSAAQKFGESLDRRKIVNLLKLFLLPEESDTFPAEFAEALVVSDPSLPLKGNFQELRLMSGVVIVSVLGEPSDEADALGLGIRAAAFPPSRVKPPQREIIAAAEAYLRDEADRIRPNSFVPMETANQAFTTQLAEFQKSDDVASTDTAAADIAAKIFTPLRENGKLLQRLAEECQVLWWLMGQFSPSLDQPLKDLTSLKYALVASFEASERTTLLPPAPSMAALLSRMISQCGDSSDSKTTLKNIVEATDAKWRSDVLGKVARYDSEHLVPIMTAIAKMHEIDDSSVWPRQFAKACPGVDVNTKVTPTSAAVQFYAELTFLSGLQSVG